MRAAGITPSAEKDLLRALADAGISIDLINVFPESVVFTIDEDKADKARAILERLQCRIHNYPPGLARFRPIGSRMRGVPGVMARIIRSLSDEGVSVLQTSDSHMTISCLIKAEEAQRAVRALHEEFRLSKNS